MRDLDKEYTTCVRELLPRLRRLGYLLSGDWHRADDLAQTTIERLYDKWRRVRAADNSSAV
jgi:DNA-directed RNA polymerase specialized sigma24 family protein